MCLSLCRHGIQRWPSEVAGCKGSVPMDGIRAVVKRVRALPAPPAPGQQGSLCSGAPALPYRVSSAGLLAAGLPASRTPGSLCIDELPRQGFCYSSRRGRILATSCSLRGACVCRGLRGTLTHCSQLSLNSVLVERKETLAVSNEQLPSQEGGRLRQVGLCMEQPEPPSCRRPCRAPRPTLLRAWLGFP